MKRMIALLLLLPFALPFAACSSGIPEKTAETAPAETAPETAPAKTETEKEEKKPEDPADDGVFRILMMSNSACYYYTDELYGLLKAAGIEAEVCNLYRSGGTLAQLWDAYLGNEPDYSFITVDKSGRKEQKDATLKFALERRNWDAISLQQGTVYLNNVREFEKAYGSCNPYAEKLYAAFRRVRPMAALYWHQVWAYQTGFTDERKGSIPTSAEQTLQYQTIRDVAHKISEDHSVGLIPVGDAWQIARGDPAVGDVLCNRLSDGGDCAHDGDIGGGQYLNACVWFEVLTGQSCVGNSFRPSYGLSETKVAALQNAAHEAVEAVKNS